MLRLAPRFFGLALLCGIGFALVKGLEYGEKIHAGIGLSTNLFFTYYFAFTMVHFIHVIIGMVVLVFLRRWSRTAEPDPTTVMWLESGAAYWHTVDIIWVLIFALLYLAK